MDSAQLTWPNSFSLNIANEAMCDAADLRSRTAQQKPKHGTEA
jgi:hypothetical protein